MVRIKLEHRRPDQIDLQNQNSAWVTIHYCLNKHSNVWTNSILPNLYLTGPLRAPLHPDPTTASPSWHVMHNGVLKGSILVFSVPTDLYPWAASTKPCQNPMSTHYHWIMINNNHTNKSASRTLIQTAFHRSMIGQFVKFIGKMDFFMLLGGRSEREILKP
jgi:hypothetical protein